MRFSTYNLHCSQCRYLLRGMDSADRCPECGHSIRESAMRRNIEISYNAKKLRKLIYGWTAAGVGFGVLGMSQYLIPGRSISAFLIFLYSYVMCGLLSMISFGMCARMYVIKEKITTEIIVGGTWSALVWCGMGLMCLTS